MDRDRQKMKVRDELKGERGGKKEEKRRVVAHDRQRLPMLLLE